MAIVETLLIKMSVRERMLIGLSLLVLVAGLCVHFYSKYKNESAWYQEKISAYQQQMIVSTPKTHLEKPTFDTGVVYRISQKTLLASDKIQRDYDEVDLIDLQLKRIVRDVGALRLPIIEHHLVLSFSGDRTQLSQLLEKFDEYYSSSQIQFTQFSSVESQYMLIIDFVQMISTEVKS